MDKFKKWLRERTRTGVIIAVVFGVGLLFFLSRMSFSIIGSMKMITYSETVGQVVACEYSKIRNMRGPDSVMYLHTVSYNVGGNTYFLTGMEIGKNREALGEKLTVYYNPKNPSDGVVKEAVIYTGHRVISIFIPYIGFALIVGLIIGVEILCKRHKKNRLKRKYGFEYNEEQKRAELEDWKEKLMSVNEDFES